MNLKGIGYIIRCSFSIAQFVTYTQTVNHWESVVSIGDKCRYYIPKGNIGTNWIANDFDDGLAK